MRRRVPLLAVCGLCVVSFVHGSSRVSGQDQAFVETGTPAVSQSPGNSRCAAKLAVGGDGCGGEKWNSATRSCECAPRGTCTELY
jgi:hypothetical protein